MKLLFDENLSPRLVDLLQDIYPGSLHVHGCGLGSIDDRRIWEFGAEHGLTIVTKDSDFYAKSVLRGAPPKVIWIRYPNCGTAHVEFVIRAASMLMSRFARDEARPCLILGQRPAKT